MAAGIEAIDFYGGRAFLDIRTLFETRGLDLRRFDNLMLQRKSVALPCEDPVSFGVNAAKPILDQLSDADRGRIQLLITATESGLDFGKSLSTYLHHYLGLGRNCRLFEVKQACYGGTDALQTAVGFVATKAAPGAKALVVATDIAKAAIKGSYIEPSQGAGAVAMLVSDHPDILEVDSGASACHSYEVMDSYRPTPELETGDSDLSLISYLDCLEHSYSAYAEKVEGADFVRTFDYLAFHTPFPGMVKGAHRMLMRKLKKSSPAVSEEDFNRRVAPSLAYCVEVGNIYSATLYLALCGIIDTAEFNTPKRVGLYSYGSGCCAEFYSGVVTPDSKTRLASRHKRESLTQRRALTMEEYDRLLELGMEWTFGIKDKTVDATAYKAIYDQAFAGRGLLVLNQVKNYHRQYVWS
jgi:polyketide biosynthesis 3-hydroxy-3-methylglutaryl-CoA synthase-like enzyme PksG